MAMRLVVIAIAAVVVVGGLGLVLAGGKGDDNRNRPNLILGSADEQIRANTEAIARAIEQYAGANGTDPSWDEVNEAGALAQFLHPWPTNPITGGPTQPTNAESPGDYRYQTAIRMPGGEYRGYVTGYLSNGTAYAVEYNF